MAVALAGRTILVTRPAAQADALCAAIEAQGGRTWRLPLLDIAPVDDSEAFAALASSLDEFDFAFFVSANAVSHGLAGIRAHRAWPPGPQAVTVGPGSATALRDAGFTEVLVPAERFDSEGVLALPEFAPDAVTGKRVLILRGDGGRELFGDVLMARGAQVSCFTCYRRLAPDVDVQTLASAASAGALDAITLTSSEAVRHLAAALTTDAAPVLAVPVFAPHERVAEAARAAGFTHVVLTDSADKGLLAGLCAHFAAG